MPVTRNIRNIRHTPRTVQHFYPTARTSSATPPSPSSTLPLTIDPIYSPTSPAASSPEPYRSSHKTRSSSSRKSPEHIRRPRNAFIIFRSHLYNTLKSDSVKLPGDRNQNQQNELSKMAAKAWKDMEEGERAPFKAIALAEKTEHKIKYPNYVYAPSGKAGSSKSKAPKKATNSRRKKSESPSPSPSPILYDFPFHHPPRRAAAQRASEKISQLDTLTPPSSVSPSSSSSNSDVHMEMEDDFIPTSEIPPLDLNATVEVKEGPQYPAIQNYVDGYSNSVHYTSDGNFSCDLIQANGAYLDLQTHLNFSPHSFSQNSMLPISPSFEGLSLDLDPYSYPSDVLDISINLPLLGSNYQANHTQWGTDANVNIGIFDGQPVPDFSHYLNYDQFS